ncbi:MAG: type II toxin-antitoxin system RelE/ParE family toxin, partial [Propionibacteriaceae bacterium]|nr:type II toxin-antitoxin system RelE/ParE family toxin [Propionibacteriaceae bacterium]
MGPPSATSIACPQRILSAVIEFTFGPLTDNPQCVGKPLRFDLFGLWSARRGSYRVLHEIDDTTTTVHVIRVSHRAEVYRLFALCGGVGLCVGSRSFDDGGSCFFGGGGLDMSSAVFGVPDLTSCC